MFCPTLIVVPVDLATGAGAALTCASDLSRVYGSRVHLLHVTPDPDTDGWAAVLPNADLDRRTAEVHQDAWDGLASFAREARSSGALRTGTGRTTLAVRASPNPAAAILEYAHEHRGDLIVMESHRASSAGPLRGGGTAERVRRHAGCPVLLVPPAVAARVPLRLPLEEAACVAVGVGGRAAGRA